MTGLINLIKKLFSKPRTATKKSYKPRTISLPKPQLSTDSYLLEYRYSGYPRKYILDRYFELKRAYKITHPKYHYVPHITLVGPITTSHEKELILKIQEIIFKNAHHFHEPGNLVGTGKYITFDTGTDGQVLAIKVKPSKSLINLKKEIESNLGAIDGFKCQVYNKQIWHTTLWNMKKNNYSSKAKFQRVWNSLKYSPQEMKFILDRITLIKNRMILKEFDLVELNVLNRIESLNNNLRYKSYLKIKTELESRGESFKFSKKDLFHDEVTKGEDIYYDKDLKENSTEIQDGTIQAEWDY